MASQAIQLPPPFKGQNDQLPEFSVQNPFCIRMQNFQNEGGTLRLRKGNAKHCSINVDGQWLGIASYGRGGAGKVFAVVDNTFVEFYDITSGTPSLAYTTPGPLTGGDDELHTLYFNNYLFFFGEVSLSPTWAGPQFFNGSTWGAAGWTFTIGEPLGGCVYKNRAYILDASSAKYAYTNIDAISGATTTVDLGTVISESAKMVAIKSVSLSENVTQENVIAFIFSSGEILVYGGSYPNSASWELKARLKTAPLIYVNAAIDAKGDTFLLTENEILSLRNLIAKGYSAERKDGLGAVIENRWRQLVAGNSGKFFLRGCYDEKNDRLVISFQNYTNPTTGANVDASCQLLYDFTLGAWYEYVHFNTESGVSNFNNVGVTYLNGDVYQLTRWLDGSFNQYAVVYKIDHATNYLDDNVVTGESGIQFELKSAPHPIQRFGVMKTDGLEAIMKSDIYSAIDFKLIGDLGAQTTQPQKTSGNGSNITKTWVNLGIEANTVQYEISGNSTSSSVGIELYATNLWVSPSEGLAR